MILNKVKKSNQHVMAKKKTNSQHMHEVEDGTPMKMKLPQSAITQTKVKVEIRMEGTMKIKQKDI